MVAVSKLFKDGIETGFTCNELVHSGSCRMNILLNTYKFLISNMKYFAPVIGLPLLVHLRSLNKEVLLSTMKYYMGNVACGATTGWSIMAMICVLRNLFGKFGYYSFIFWPSFIGSFALYAVPCPRAHRLFQTSTFQCTIESFVMQQKTLLTKAIARSKLFRTFIFMTCSGLIMNAKRERTYKGFWLLEPTPCITHQTCQEDNFTRQSELSSETAYSDTDSQLSSEEAYINSTHNNSCSHLNKSCTRYAMEGLRNYMIIGMTLDFIKMLLAKTSTDKNDLMGKLIAKLKMFRIRSCALLTLYIAMYRFLHCYLNRNNGGDSRLNHTLAAILSGSSFIFYPKLTILCYALLMGIQISWQHVTAHLTSERYEHKFEWVKQLPCSAVIYPVALGYLVNTFCTRPRYTSTLAETIINGTTNKYAKAIQATVAQLEKQLENST